MMHLLGDIVFCFISPAIAGWALVMLARELAFHH